MQALVQIRPAQPADAEVAAALLYSAYTHTLVTFPLQEEHERGLVERLEHFCLHTGSLRTLSRPPAGAWHFERDRLKWRPAIIDHGQAGWADQSAVRQLAVFHVGAWPPGVMAAIQTWPVAANQFTLDDRQALFTTEVAHLDTPVRRLWCFGTRGAPEHAIRAQILAEMNPHPIDGLADVDEGRAVAHGIDRTALRMLPAG